MLNVTSNFVPRFRAQLAQFRREEDGTLIIFGLTLFVLMIMMGGFAVDLMRYENVRVNLQQTLDRSTLAAAALNQSLDPHAVVVDYMLKAGLADQLENVQVTEALNSRTVRSVGRAATHPIFLHMLGIQSFDAMGRSQAEQSVTNVEVVLVLDISGSMQSNNKIGNLKTAASEFVDTILANDPNHRVSISIVPYNAEVNIGPQLVSKFAITNPNGVANVNCVELPPSVYGSLALSRIDSMPMVAYADIVYGTNRINGLVSPTDATFARPNYGRVFCKPNPANQVRLPSNNAVTIKSEINALQAEGNTSITLGMKWGVTLLDPSMRSMFTDFIGSGAIPASMPSRPFDYRDPGTMKIIVLMTDGQHVAHDRIVDAYKTGPAPIYLSTGDGNYSVRHTAGRPAVAGSNEYFVPHLGTWQATPWDSGAGAVQQDWAAIWANLKLSYVAWQFYGRALGTDATSRNTVYSNTFSAMDQIYASAATMDATLQQSCQGARDQGVIVYGIAFEAPTHGQEVIRNCASSPAHYFAADGLQIQNAFRTIASNITMLKLTQ